MGDAAESAPEEEQAPGSLQSRLQDPPDAGAGERDWSSVTGDPVGLFHKLEMAGRFHRDKTVGRIFHPGKVSFREHRPTDSLHVTIQHNRISAHVDKVSPLAPRSDGSPRYSPWQIALHNVSGITADLMRFLRGRQGDHRSELNCEWTGDGTGSRPGDEIGGEVDGSDRSVTTSAEAEAAPWNVQLEARVSGRLDDSRLRAAIAETLVPAGGLDPLLVFDCPDDASLDAARVRMHSWSVPVDQSPPMRVWLAHHPAGDLVMLNVNHAAADGFGALSILGAVAAAYARNPATPPAPQRLELLALRDLPVRPSRPGDTPVLSAYWGVRERVQSRLRPPAGLAPDGAGHKKGYGFHLLALSADDTRMLVHHHQAGSHTDVLLAALHRAIGEWNAEHGQPGGRIGLLTTVSLRSEGWPALRIGNFSVTARISTSRGERSTPATAYRAVTDQTARNRRNRTGTALIEALDRSGLLPLWAKQSRTVLTPLTANRLVDSALLSDLGVLDAPPSFGEEAGETVAVWFSAPARMPIGLAVGAVTVSERLHLVFRYRRRLFGPDGARRFADCYLSELRQVAVAPHAGQSRRPRRDALP